MNAIDNLIETLKNHETVKAYQATAKIINNNPKYKAIYQDLTKKQKAMIQAREAKHPSYQEKLTDYNATLEAIEDLPVVHQYLTLLEEVNSLTQQIQSLIESAIDSELETITQDDNK